MDYNTLRDVAKIYLHNNIHLLQAFEIRLLLLLATHYNINLKCCTWYQTL